MSNSRTSNSLKNISASLIYQIVNFALSFISRSVFIEVLGVGYLGINGLFNDVLSMLNLAELGFGTVMTFSMYKPLAQKDYTTLTGLTHFYKKVYRIIALSIAGIGLLLVPFLPHLVNLEQEIPNLTLYYLLFLASNVASYLVTYKTTVMYADQKNYILLKYASYRNIAQSILLTLILYITENYIVFLCVQVICVYAQNFHASYIAQKNYPYIKNKVTLPKEKTKGLFKDVGSAFIYKIAHVLITATDNTLISVLVSTEMVGYYSNYSIFIGRLTHLFGTIFSSLIASLGNLIAKESAEKRYQVFQTMQSLCLMVSGFCVSCVFILQEDLIRVWLGEEFLIGLPALIVICANFFLNVALKPILSFREAAGLFRKTKFVMLWTAGINITLSILLGKQWGLVGILAATTVSKLLTHFWYEPVLLFREFFQKSCWIYFFDMLKGSLLMLLSLFIAGFATHWFVPSNWFELILKAVLVAGICASTIVICNYRSPGFAILKKKLFSMLPFAQKSK